MLLKTVEKISGNVQFCSEISQRYPIFEIFFFLASVILSS